MAGFSKTCSILINYHHTWDYMRVKSCSKFSNNINLKEFCFFNAFKLLTGLYLYSIQSVYIIKELYIDCHIPSGLPVSSALRLVFGRTVQAAKGN